MLAEGDANGPHLRELPLGNTVTVEDDPGGFEAGGFVELDEELPHHVGQVLDDFLARTLHAHRGTVPAGVGVHAAHNLQGQRQARLTGYQGKDGEDLGLSQLSDCFQHPQLAVGSTLSSQIRRWDTKYHEDNCSSERATLVAATSRFHALQCPLGHLQEFPVRWLGWHH